MPRKSVTLKGGAAGVVPDLAVELWETLAEKGDLVASITASAP